MSYNVNNVVDVNVYLSIVGLQKGNFGLATLFAKSDDTPSGFDADTYRVYESLSGFSADFGVDTETYKSGAKLLGAIPRQKKLYVWATNENDESIADTLNKARNKFWWFYSVFTKEIYALDADVLAIAEWCNQNRSMFINNQTGASANEIRDPSKSDDIASQLNAKGYDFVSTFTHATDAYAGNALIPWYSNVDYEASNSTITGEYKRLSGVIAEDLDSTANQAMTNKNVVSYQKVELDGQVDNGRVINTKTHSGRFLDSVIDLEAFINDVQVSIYNTITSAPKKLPQTPKGQHAVILSAESSGERFINNNYLGPREYIDENTGENKISRGFDVLTKPEDIYTISDDDRKKRLCAPININAYPAGAIHSVVVNLNVEE